MTGAYPTVIFVPGISTELTPLGVGRTFDLLRATLVRQGLDVGGFLHYSYSGFELDGQGGLLPCPYSAEQVAQDPAAEVSHLAAAVGWAVENRPGRIAIVGHSYGGAVALRYLQLLVDRAGYAGTDGRLALVAAVSSPLEGMPTSGFWPRIFAYLTIYRDHVGRRELEERFRLRALVRRDNQRIVAAAQSIGMAVATMGGLDDALYAGPAAWATAYDTALTDRDELIATQFIDNAKYCVRWQNLGSEHRAVLQRPECVELLAEAVADEVLLRYPPRALLTAR